MNYDIQAFNEQNETFRFRVNSQSLVRINPYLHNTVMPFIDLQTWKGTLTYRVDSTRLKELRGSRLAVEFKPLTEALGHVDDPINLYWEGEKEHDFKRYEGGKVPTPGGTIISFSVFSFPWMIPLSSTIGSKMPV